MRLPFQRAAFLLVAATLCTFTARAQLSGTYTINPSGSATSTNYLSIEAAVGDMVGGSRSDGGTANGSGVNGPVVFNIADGNYNEQVVIDAITGASGTNRITFQSASGDSSQVVIYEASSSSSTNNYCIKLDGSSYITFKQVTIERTGTNTYQRGLELAGGSHHVWLLGCQLKGGQTTTASNNRASIYSGTSRDTALKVRNCRFINNSYAMYLTATSSTHEPGLVVEDCIFDEVYAYGVYVLYQYHPVVRRNNISDIPYTSGRGIFVSNGTESADIHDNIIANHRGLYGIYFTGSSFSSSNPAKIYNNFIHSVGTGNMTGIYLTGSGPADVVHNTIQNEATGSTSRGIYIASTTSATYALNLYNNNVAHLGGGRALDITTNAVTAGVLDNSDYNNFYSSGGTTVQAGTTGYATLGDWKSATSYDANSVSVEPLFVAMGDPRPRSAGLSGAGTNMGTRYALDLNGEPRGSNPDIGAVQFAPTQIDQTVVALEQLNLCGDSFTFVQVVAQNMGALSDTLRVKVDDAVSGESWVLRSTRKIDNLETDTFMLGPLNTYFGGELELTAYTITAGDEFPENDTLRAEFSYIPFPQRPDPFSRTVCRGDSMIIELPDSFSLFASLTDENPIATGPALVEIPAVDRDTTFYYARGAEGNFQVSKDANFSNGTYISSSYFMQFDVSQTITLDSVKIYTNGAANNLVVELRAGATTTLKTITVSTSGAGAHWVHIDYQLPPGTDYRLGITNFGGTTVFRETTGNASLYPFTYDYLEVTGNTFNNLNYWYWMFDWRYRLVACSGERETYTVTTLDKPGGAIVQQGSTFSGYFGAGTETDMDSLCAEKLSVYEITPPAKYTNSGFGTDWAISSLDFRAVGGTPPYDTVMYLPTPSSNGRLEFTPRFFMSDSLLRMDVTITDLNNMCDSTFTRWVYVVAGGQLDFTYDYDCDTDTLRLTMLDTRPGTTYSFWVAGTTLQGSEVSYHVSSFGLQRVFAKQVTPFGCPDSIERYIYIPAHPQAGFTWDRQQACASATVDFTNQSAGDSVEYHWDFGDGASTTSTNPTHFFPGQGVYTVTLTAVSVRGCSSQVQHQVDVLASVSAGFSVSNVCEGEPLPITNTATDAVRYKYYFGNGDTSTLEVPTYAYPAPGTYTISQVAWSAGDCRDSVTQSVTIFERPMPDITGDSLVCVGTSTRFTGSTGGALGGYVWFVDGVQVANTSIVNHTFASPGTYAVKVVFTSQNGCADSTSMTVEAVAPPSAEFTMAESSCPGQEVMISNDAARPGFTYRWTTSEGQVSTDEQPSISFLARGTKTVTLEVTSDVGCIALHQETIEIYDAPVAAISSTATDTCAGSPIVLRDASAYNNGPASHNRWTYGKNVLEDQNEITVVWPDTGPLTVTLEVWNQSEQWGDTLLRGCVSTTQHTVVFHGEPSVDFTFETDSLVATLAADEIDDADSYTWDFGDGNTGTGRTVEHGYAENGTYQVLLTVKTRYGCEASTTKAVVVNYVSIRPDPVAGGMRVFPNPTTGELFADLELNEATSLTVFFTDAQSRRLGQPRQGQYPAGALRLELGSHVSGLPAGMYFLHIVAPNMAIKPIQVVVTK